MFGYIRHYWTDKRFAGKFSETIRLKGSIIECAWIPDTYVINTRESNLLAENSNGGSLFEIHPNGTIFYSRRLVFNSFVDQWGECHIGFLKPLFADIEKNNCFPTYARSDLNNRNDVRATSEIIHTDDRSGQCF